MHELRISSGLYPWFGHCHWSVAMQPPPTWCSIAPGHAAALARTAGRTCLPGKHGKAVHECLMLDRHALKGLSRLEHPWNLVF